MTLHLVVDFDPFFGDGADPAHVVSTTVQELPKVGQINKFFDLCLVGLLPKFTPHGTEHEFSQSTLTGVFADVGMVEDNVFAFKVYCGAVLGIPICFFLEFEPRVNVLGKEADLRVGKMVDLMNVEQPVAFLEGHVPLRAHYASV